MSDSREPIDRLVQESRSRGRARVFAEGTAADAVSRENGQRVVEGVLEYLSESGMSRSAVARAIGVAASTVGMVLSWKYPGNWPEIILDLDRWLEVQQQRDAAPRGTPAFVSTQVAEEIRAVAGAAVTLGTIGLVFGSSGAGKTMALQAVAAEKAGAVLVTAEKMSASTSGMLRAIARELRICECQSQVLYHRIKGILAGTPRLLIIDQIHNLCTGKDDRPLFVLSDLHDATGAPQLWCGTTDVVAYLNRGEAKGREPLAQIRRRIGICRDLSERTRGDDGGPGEPLFSVEEIRRVFARSAMKLSPDGAMYLQRLACLPDGGGLGAARNLVVMACKVHESRAEVLTAAMLRSVHRLLASRRVCSHLELEMRTDAPAPKARAIPA